MSTEVLLGILGVLFSLMGAAIAITGRLLWSGFQATLIKAILDSSLKELLGGIQSSLNERITAEVSINGSIIDLRAGQRQSAADISALRQQFDATESAQQDRQENYWDFRRRIEDAVSGLTTALRTHTHTTTPQE